MPPDRSRWSNPQGRQKSCAECAKAKRRCDLSQPRCLRCNLQNLQCNYPPQPVHNETAALQNATSDSNVVNDDIARDVVSLDNLPNEHTIGLLDFDFATGLDSATTINDLLNDNTEDSFPVSIQRYSPTIEFLPRHISPEALSRIKYSMEQMKLAPRTMVIENSTLWVHPSLYEEHMPPSLQGSLGLILNLPSAYHDAIHHFTPPHTYPGTRLALERRLHACAVCALYNSKNDKNHIFVNRYISERASDLIRSPTPSEKLAVLARAHALLLYHCIFFFGGEMQHYPQSEAILSELDTLSRTLTTIAQQETDPSGPLPLYPSTAARLAWKTYKFRESLRRTLLVVFQTISVCNLLLGRLSTCHHLAADNRVTFSAHLWHAESAFDFAVAWNDPGKRHFLVRDMDITELLEVARPEDVDVFGKVMLTGILGVDDVRGWFVMRGGAL